MPGNVTEGLAIKIPININGDLDGFRFMAECLKKVKTNNGNIVFDFKENVHFDLPLTAVLGIIVKTANEQGLACIIRNLSMELKEMWKHNGFMYYFIKLNAIEKGRSRKGDVERYLEVNEQQLHEAADYIGNEFLSAEECPKMSEPLKKEMMTSILELINNAHVHGGMKYAVLCGHTSHDDEKLCFCVTNTGKTFRMNISEFLKNNLPLEYKNHIDWAVAGNTTKNETGGLGLRLLREFIEKNNGCIQICSDKEYWIQDSNGIISYDNLTEELMGTVVYLEINIQDVKAYYLTSEIPLNGT